jgi:hypothetical protein
VSGLKPRAGGSPTSFRKSCQGRANTLATRLRDRPKGPQKFGPRPCRLLENPGNPGISGGSYAEKNPVGMCMAETHGMPFFSATIPVAYAAMLPTSRSVPSVVARMSSYDSRKLIKCACTARIVPHADASVVL